eukprot:TRINITY_DN13950_c0_g1_i4.p1 TRINITY_DN13950_c0_g1~~TRINITY_DN13950_c0_g1_i4.p1  ORF type:complete len:805 (+),score=104.61 TRINITY_DN13950_c0_g1_i4:78-2492(+)
MVSRNALLACQQKQPLQGQDDLLHMTDINLEYVRKPENSHVAALSFQELLDKVSEVHRKQEGELESLTAENLHLRELLGAQKTELCSRKAELRSPASTLGNVVLDKETSFASALDFAHDRESFSDRVTDTCRLSVTAQSGSCESVAKEEATAVRGSMAARVATAAGTLARSLTGLLDSKDGSDEPQNYNSWGNSRWASENLSTASETVARTPLESWAFFVSSQCKADLACRFGVREHWVNILTLPIVPAFGDQVDYLFDFNRSGKASVSSGSTGLADFRDEIREYESWFRRPRTWVLREAVIFHPQCQSRLVWVGVGVALLVYELLIMSLQVFDLEATNVQKGMEWICSTYWTLDVVMSFLTATFVKGHLSMDLRVIASSYIASWFCFDVFILVCQWNLLLMGQGNDRAFFRHLRKLRYIRLMRLLKLFQLLPSLLATVTNPVHKFSLEVAQFVFFIIVWIHVSACGFYGVHLLSDAESPSISRIPENNKLTRYLVCAHWASAQLQGSSDIAVVDDALPRFYALAVIMVAIPFCALFVSRLTNIMMELHDLTKSNAVQQRNIRDYLSRHRISTDLSGQVLEFVKWRQNVEKSRTDKNDSNVLNMLPKHLRGALIDESLAPLLSKHVFWQCLKADFEPYFKVVLLNVFKSQFLLPHEVVFNFGGVASSAYIVECGDLTLLHYSKIAKSLIKTSAKLNKESRNMQDRLLKARSLSSGTCVSEMALWLRCAHKGDLRAESQAWVQTVSADMIEFYVKDYPVLQRAMARHARHFARELAHHMQDDPDLFTTSDMACGHSNQRQTTCRA